MKVPSFPCWNKGKFSDSVGCGQQKKKKNLANDINIELEIDG